MHALSKVLKICQQNSVKLDKIADKQLELEGLIKEQNNKIDTILSKIEERGDAEIVASKDKSKDKGKRSRHEFYQVNIYFIIVSFVYGVVFI